MSTCWPSRRSTGPWPTAAAPTASAHRPGPGRRLVPVLCPGLVGDDFRPLAGPDPGGPAYGNLLVSRLPLVEVEQLRFPSTGGGEQRTALLVSIQVGARRSRWRHPPVQQAGPQPAPAVGAAAAGWVPNGAAAAGGRPEPALHGGGGGLSAGLARDRGPDLAQLASDPAAGPRPVEQPGRGGPPSWRHTFVVILVPVL